jgi:predicted TIM-barrel fold metal-dependent hydrolase
MARFNGHLISLIVGFCGSLMPSGHMGSVVGQDSVIRSTADDSNHELTLREFRPRSMLQVPNDSPTAAKFPVVDVHTHFVFKLRGSEKTLDDYVELMDRNNIVVNVSLDGQLGDRWHEHQTLLWTKYKQRFVIFVHIDWRGSAAKDDVANWDCHRPEFARRIARQLGEAKGAGASGLKIFKSLGLQHRNPDGSHIAIDDPRWDPIWEACGKLGLPVLIHTADPMAFFEPIDATNERWEELSRHPEWSFSADAFPSREALLAARNRVIARHPKTTFIGAHMANNPEDLAQVGRWLDHYPNLVVEIASRIGELGRQPYTTRRFFDKYQDRILFGTDGPWPEARVRLYWRFLETNDEYFPYSEKPFPPQGFWRIYGIGLSDEVLEKVYYKNAARIVPGVSERIAAWSATQD